ncbi:MAG: Ribosomal RNA small subunit methyltransferase B [Syntrophaceae bacterium PtaB.Bin038]|nr:MAG: Ribosomal RNA small subunit methyltransferase B [Syntrophaceae bacterium PtaB.Bin038]
MRLPPSLKDSPRALAVHILNRVDAEGAYAEPLLDSVLSSGRPRAEADRALLTFLVYGTLRTRGLLDFLIDRFYRGNPATLDPGVRNILRVALYQVRFAEKIPAYAAVDEAVGTAKRLAPGRDKLVNAILRNALRGLEGIEFPDPDSDPVGHLCVALSHPRWLVERWIGSFGLEEARALCRADNEIPPFTLRVNSLKTSRAKMLERLEREGFEVRATALSPDGIILAKTPAPPRDLPEIADGLLLIQDEASQLIPHLLAPRSGERVLDLCAGSGGKTTHLAALMENGGEIVAADNRQAKLRALESTARRWGALAVRTAIVDATDPNGTVRLGTFDRVLVDAPCSGLGTLRRNPEIRWHLTEPGLAEMPPLQGRILANAAACVRPGGTLLYSTCSVMPEENDGVVAAFLEAHPDFSPHRPPPAVPAGTVGAEGYFRTFPHRHGTDGFFGALLVRR